MRMMMMTTTKTMMLKTLMMRRCSGLGMPILSLALKWWWYWGWWWWWRREKTMMQKTMMMRHCSGRGMSTTLGSAKRRQLPRPSHKSSSLSSAYWWKTRLSHKSSSLSSAYWWRRKNCTFSRTKIIILGKNPPAQHSTCRFFSNQTDCFLYMTEGPTIEFLLTVREFHFQDTAEKEGYFPYSGRGLG